MMIHPVLKDVMVKEWGNDGIICTDGGALGLLITDHKSFPDKEHGSAAGVKAGINRFLDEETWSEVMRHPGVEPARLRSIGKLRNSTKTAEANGVRSCAFEVIEPESRIEVCRIIFNKRKLHPPHRFGRPCRDSDLPAGGCGLTPK